MVFASTMEGQNELLKLINSFVKAGENDPYLEAITGGKEKSHNHGWGYAISGSWRKSEEVWLFSYKSRKPVYEDSHGLINLSKAIESSEWVVGVIHSRKATRGLSTSYLDVHPFHAVTAEGAELWLAHNGSLDRSNPRYERISRLPSERSDSLALTLYLGQVGLTRIPDTLGFVIKERIVKTALNLGMLVAEPGTRPYAQGLHYHLFRGSGRALEDYYKLYEVKSAGLYALISSTIAMYYGGKHHEAPFKEFIRIRVNEHGLIEVEKGEVL